MTDKQDVVTAGQVVSIHYTLKNDDGAVLDSSSGRDPLQYLHGSRNIVPGLERALDGHTAGDRIETSIPPELGYGQHDPRGVQSVPKSAFPDGEELKPGMQFATRAPDGSPVPFWVMEVTDEAVVVDMNHPLAGQTLHFEVDIVSTRDATEDEQKHGHPHAE